MDSMVESCSDEIPKCARSECENEGNLICSRCKLERYCSVDCQRQCWKKHGKVCVVVAGVKKDVSAENTNQGSTGGIGKVNIGTDNDEIVDVYREGTNVALYVSGKGIKGKIQSFNLGKGPFADPLARIDVSKHGFGTPWFDRLLEDPCSCLPNYAVQYDNGTVELHEASEIHRSWVVLDSKDDRMKALKSCTIEASEYKYPNGEMSNFTLVSTLFPHDKCNYSQGMRTLLDNDDYVHRFTQMTLGTKEELLGSFGRATCFVIFNVGTMGPSDLKGLYHEDLRVAFTTFVKTGGILIIQGEGCVCKIFQDWFKLPWERSGYYSSEIKLSKECSALPSKIVETLPSSIFLNANYLINVKPENNLYVSSDNEGDSAVAVSNFGEGRVAFIGDVNAEMGTLKIIQKLGHSAR